MNQTLQTKSKRNSSLKGTKLVLATLGVTSILGFWALFSRQAPGSQIADNSLLDNLPPIPTLVPALSEASLPASQASLPAAAKPAPSSETPSTVFMGGTKPSSQSKVVRVITRTRSS